MRILCGALKSLVHQHAHQGSTKQAGYKDLKQIPLEDDYIYPNPRVLKTKVEKVCFEQAY
jgi:hypothetical protein